MVIFERLKNGTIVVPEAHDAKLSKKANIWASDSYEDFLNFFLLRTC